MKQDALFPALTAILTLFLPVIPRGEGAEHEGADLRAGAAVVDITPPAPLPLWGYAARKATLSEGVLDPLHARALVLEVGQRRLALVSLDLGRAPARASLARIEKRLGRHGVDQLFLVASHTHHAPVLELENIPTQETSYVRFVEGRLVEVIGRAVAGLRPARLGVLAHEGSWGRNRHSRRPDAPVDRQMLILRVEDLRGKALAHAVNLAAHPTLLDRRELKVSADYPGVLAGLVEKETGVPCLFLQGAAGDLAPHPGKGRTPGAYGEALGREILGVLGKVRCTVGERTTLVGLEEGFTFRSRLPLGNPLIQALYSAAFYPDLVAFYEREYREGVRPRLTVALLDGRIGLVGVSGEMFCGHALSLRRRARLEHLFFLGYCNDYQQYFPTIEAAAEGGYGADMIMAPAEVGAGERMMDRALIHLYRMRGKLRDGK